MRCLILAFVAWHLVCFGFRQVKAETEDSIPVQKAHEILTLAKTQWDLAEVKSVYVQGKMTHKVVGIVDGISTVQSEGEAGWKRNKTGGVFFTSTIRPRTLNETVINNSLYFAVVESPVGRDQLDLNFLGWINNGQDPPVDHALWYLTKSIPDLAKPYVIDTLTCDLMEIVGHPKLNITSAHLENGMLNIVFELYLEHPTSKTGVDDILGGKLTLRESLNWFPEHVEIVSGNRNGLVYSTKSMTLKYREHYVQEFPLLERKTLSWKVLKQFPGWTTPAGYESIQQTDLDLTVVGELPPDKEFRLSAFGLPEPVRPGSISATWWKWGGCLLVAGIVFALIAAKLGRGN